MGTITFGLNGKMNQMPSSSDLKGTWYPYICMFSKGAKISVTPTSAGITFNFLHAFFCSFFFFSFFFFFLFFFLPLSFFFFRFSNMHIDGSKHTAHDIFKSNGI